MAVLANKIGNRFYSWKRVDNVNGSNQIGIQVEMGRFRMVAGSFVTGGVFRASSIADLSNHWPAGSGFGNISLAKTEPVAICRISYVCGGSFLGSQSYGAVPLGNQQGSRGGILY